MQDHCRVQFHPSRWGVSSSKSTHTQKGFGPNCSRLAQWQAMTLAVAAVKIPKTKGSSTSSPEPEATLSVGSGTGGTEWSEEKNITLGFPFDKLTNSMLWYDLNVIDSLLKTEVSWTTDHCFPDWCDYSFAHSLAGFPRGFGVKHHHSPALQLKIESHIHIIGPSHVQWLVDYFLNLFSHYFAYVDMMVILAPSLPSE